MLSSAGSIQLWANLRKAKWKMQKSKWMRLRGWRIGGWANGNDCWVGKAFSWILHQISFLSSLFSLDLIMEMSIQHANFEPRENISHSKWQLRHYICGSRHVIRPHKALNLPAEEDAFNEKRWEMKMFHISCQCMSTLVPDFPSASAMQWNQKINCGGMEKREEGKESEREKSNRNKSHSAAAICATAAPHWMPPHKQ